MSDLTSFLFQGSPATSTTTTFGPEWLQKALSSTVGNALNLSQQPYQPYQGQLVASPSAQTQKAWNLAGQNVGGYQPYLSQAGALTGAAAAPITSNDVSQFLNPYQSYITGALTQNFNQNVLPSIQDKFVGAGQSRSPQEAQVTSNATRDLNTSIGQSLAGAYQGALNSLLQQRGQMGSLGAQYGQLGALSSQLGSQDVSQLANAGQAQDLLQQERLNSAYGQWQQQRQWPYQQLGFLSSIMGGLPLQYSGVTQKTTATPQQNSGLGDLLGLGSVLSGFGLFKDGGRVSPARGALSSALKQAA